MQIRWQYCFVFSFVTVISSSHDYVFWFCRTDCLVVRRVVTTYIYNLLVKISSHLYLIYQKSQQLKFRSILCSQTRYEICTNRAWIMGSSKVFIWWIFTLSRIPVLSLWTTNTISHMYMAALAPILFLWMRNGKTASIEGVKFNIQELFRVSRL